MQDFISVFDSIYPILLAVIGVLVYLFQLFITFLGITLLAFIGSAMSGQRKLSYKQVWTLTAYSYTIPTIFFMIMDLFKIVVPGSTFIYIAVVLIVLYLTIKEVPKRTKKCLNRHFFQAYIPSKGVKNMKRLGIFLFVLVLGYIFYYDIKSALYRC